MKKISITVDGAGSVSPIGGSAGFYGEHLVTELEITLSGTFSENCEYYKMNIDGYVSGRLTPTDGKISYTLPQSVLRPPAINCQVIGYKMVDDVPVMVVRSSPFALTVEISPCGKSPEIIADALEPLEIALAECGNTVAASKQLLEDISGAQSAVHKELNDLKDETVSYASTAVDCVNKTMASAASAANSASAAANSASEAAASAASAASSAASVNPNNYYKKSETYSKTEVNKQFAARSSANSADDSSVRFSQCLWNKGHDDGTDSYVTVDDAKPANDVYLWSSQKTMSAVEENVTDTINQYKTNEFQYNYAARSSPNSGSASSVASAKGLWVKADDTGESGTAELQDSLKSSDKVLWSSKKTDEEIKKQSNLLCNALKGSKSGSAVQIDDVSPTNGELKVSVASKNLVPYPSYTSRTSNGITATVNSDGSITLNGTNTGTAASTFTLVSKFSLDKIIYTSSGGTFIDSAKTYYVNLTIDTHKDNKWVKTFGNMGNASGTQIDNSEGLYDDGTISLSITKGATVTDFVIKPQLEIGTSRTEYTPHISDLSSVTVKAYETDPTDIKATYTPNEDGTVEGVTAVSPTTTLTTDNSGVVLNCEYNRDINKAFAELQQAIISLGGNI